MCTIGDWRRAVRIPQREAKVAFRAFESNGYGRLKGMFVTFFYKAGVNRPRRGDRVGITYGYSTDGLWSYTSPGTAMARHWFADAYAKVKVWGTTSLHRSGHRSMYLQIVRIVVNGNYIDAIEVKQIRARYKVPVVIVKGRRSAIRAALLR